jgi:Spy/CpxP family protein refolding chaperone
MNNRTKWLMVALAMTGVAGAVMGQTSSSSSGAGTTAAPGAHHWHHGHRMMLGGGLLHAFRQLNLTPAQQQSVHTILTAAHSQSQAERAAGGKPDFTVLSNPGDPNYATALQDLQTRMASRLQAQSQTELALYNVLTKQQQAQLPTILASMKARMSQHATT